MAGVITASEPSWIAPFTGLSPRIFGKLVTALRREGANPVRRGRPLEDRVLLVAGYWRTNLTMRQLAPLFGISKSAADRIIDQLGPLFALQPRRRFARDAALIVDGTLVPTRDHSIAEQSKNYRYSTNHQVIIDADTRLFARRFGPPVPARSALWAGQSPTGGAGGVAGEVRGSAARLVQGRRRGRAGQHEGACVSSSRG